MFILLTKTGDERNLAGNSFHILNKNCAKSLKNGLFFKQKSTSSLKKPTIPFAPGAKISPGWGDLWSLVDLLFPGTQRCGEGNEPVSRKNFSAWEVYSGGRLRYQARF
jgi:hypothetical protein